MTSYTKRVGEVRNSCEKGAKRLKEDAHGF